MTCKKKLNKIRDVCKAILEPNLDYTQDSRDVAFRILNIIDGHDEEFCLD